MYDGAWCPEITFRIAGMNNALTNPTGDMQHFLVPQDIMPARKLLRLRHQAVAEEDNTRSRDQPGRRHQGFLDHTGATYCFSFSYS